jgi:hypothetical protein
MISFDFKKKDLYQQKIDDSLILCIERISNSYATLFFQDDTGNKIHIPNDICVYDSVYDDKNGTLQLKSCNGGMYYLGWTENFEIHYKNKIILKINNPRIWNFLIGEN